jgi:hypothetical protein
VVAVSTNRASRQPRQAGRGRPRRPRPLPPGDTLFTPDPSPARASFEQRSATPLLWLHQLPRWLVPVLAVGLLVIGFALRGWGGAIALLAVAALLGWLAAVSWPRLSAQGRLLRVAATAVIVAIAVFRGLH